MTNPVKCELWFRKKVTVNTDPQRRCYDGCNFSEATVWTDWSLIGPYSREDAESSAKTFRGINPSHQYEVRPMRDPCPYQSELLA